MPSPSLMLLKASKSGSSDLSPSSASSSCHDAFQQLIRWECNKWCLASKRSQFPLLAFRVVNAVPPQWPSRRYHAFKSCCANICNLFNAATTLTCSFNHTCSFSLIWFDVYSDDVVITGIVLCIIWNPINLLRLTAVSWSGPCLCCWSYWSTAGWCYPKIKLSSLASASSS